MFTHPTALIDATQMSWFFVHVKPEIHPQPVLVNQQGQESLGGAGRDRQIGGTSLKTKEDHSRLKEMESSKSTAVATRAPGTAAQQTLVSCEPKQPGGLQGIWGAGGMAIAAPSMRAGQLCELAAPKASPSPIILLTPWVQPEEWQKSSKHRSRGKC